MSELKVNSIVDASGGSTARVNGFTPTISNMSGRNRIINGDMRIDQRNNGASVTMNNTVQYLVDRWFSFEDTDGTMTAQRSTVAPAGFTNSLLCTTTSADASLGATQRVLIGQRIEGFNVADLGWGTANAQAVTLSFWVRSSLTGTFGGVFKNSASNRGYPFTYAIGAANTWEQKTVTVPGDTTGTWLTDNGYGIEVDFGLGVGSTFSGTAGAWAGADLNSATGAVSVVGTNGATFYITGVQLEAGSVATPFERRPYGTELALCQRYFIRFSHDGVGYGGIATGFQTTATSSVFSLTFPVQMRAKPTAIAVNLISTDDVTDERDANLSNVTPAFLSSSVSFTYASYGAQFRPASLKIKQNTSGSLAFNSEL